MKRSRFSEEQIIGILREQEAGATTAEICRRHGVGKQSFYRWKSKYGGVGRRSYRRRPVAGARALRTSEDD